MTKVVVVSGLSGSGKTLALRCLEDMGFFAVDNLPVMLCEPFIELLGRGEGGEPRGAFVTDVRERQHLEELPALLERLRARPGLQLTVLFLDAREQTLVRRYSESRRPHPLAVQLGIPVGEAIRREVALLAPLKAAADRVFSSDETSPHELRRAIQLALAGVAAQPALTAHLVSFGFKYGAPQMADMMFDVRFLPNPYFVAGLRQYDGRHARIQEFLEAQPDFVEFLAHLERLVGFVMPRYVAEGKSYLTLAIGCTGGRHRSVAIAERLGRFLAQSGYAVDVVHRDLEREALRDEGHRP